MLLQLNRECSSSSSSSSRRTQTTASASATQPSAWQRRRPMAAGKHWGRSRRLGRGDAAACQAASRRRLRGIQTRARVARPVLPPRPALVPSFSTYYCCVPRDRAIEVHPSLRAQSSRGGIEPLITRDDNLGYLAIMHPIWEGKPCALRSARKLRPAPRRS